MIILRSKRFIKQMATMPQHLRRRALERINLLAKDESHPLLNNHELEGRYIGDRSINVSGDWRIVYTRIDPQTIYLRTIGTHHQLYGK